MPHRPEKEGGTFVIRKIVDTDGKEIDKGLCLIFRAPGSYTGEHTVEIQGHGGAVVLRKILRRALDAGARIAEPGEFTRRAFLNGKMDLVQAEVTQRGNQSYREDMDLFDYPLSPSARLYLEQISSLSGNHRANKHYTD